MSGTGLNISFTRCIDTCIIYNVIAQQKQPASIGYIRIFRCMRIVHIPNNLKLLYVCAHGAEGGVSAKKLREMKTRRERLKSALYLRLKKRKFLKYASDVFMKNSCFRPPPLPHQNGL